jgi:hypothetical protein
MSEPIPISSRTERAQARLRLVVYSVLAVLSVGALVSAAATLAFLGELKEQGDRQEQLAMEIAEQGDQQTEERRRDAEDRAGRVDRLNGALRAVEAQFVRQDEADAARLEVLRADLLAAITAIDCAPGQPAPQPARARVPLPRRAAPSLPAPTTTTTPAPPPAPQAEPSSPVVVPPDRCTLSVLGVCVGG